MQEESTGRTYRDERVCGCVSMATIDPYQIEGEGGRYDSIARYNVPR